VTAAAAFARRSAVAGQSREAVRVHLLYFHGSTLRAYEAMGKTRFLDALNPRGLFDSVRMVDLDPEGPSDLEEVRGRFRFTSVGLARLGPGRLAKLRALRQAVVRLAADPRPDLVVGDDANLLGLSARWAARRAGVPYALCVFYDNDLHYRLTGRGALAFLRSRALEAALERVVFRGATGVYGGNRGYLDYGLRHGARRERAYLGSWCVDEIFYGDPVPPHPDGREVFFVGRLHPLKYVEDLLEALTRLPPRIRLDVAGEGPHRPHLERTIAALGLAGRVRLLGLLPREEILARMQAARVLVVTQGFNAAVESLLSGRPVVAYDHECNAEVVRNEETGLVVPFRDAPALTAAIRRVLDDAGLAGRLGRTGRERMLEECSIPASIEHRRRFLEGCLAR
jgi:glycosyltransferase involved in cell wall biosynthesis